MLVIGIVIVILFVLYFIVTYNQLIQMRNRVKESFAAIDVYLQNRFDALTKVAESVVSYAEHERETLENVTKLREGMKNGQDVSERMNAYTEMEKTLHSINIQAEAYPELKASENYMQMQRTINDLEEKLSASRRTYNANVTSFNTKISSFPTNIFAGALGFKQETLLKIEASKKVDVDLKSILKG